MKQFHPGDLREQIDIVHDVVSINENGYPEPIREVVHQKLWAAVEDAADQMTQAADAQLAQDIVRFVLRHRQPMDVGMLMSYQGEVYEIIGIEHVGMHRAYLSLKTKLTKGVAG